MKFVKELNSSSIGESSTEYNWTLDTNEVDHLYQTLYDPLADTLETDARRRFLEADRLYFIRAKKHIDINEGTTAEGNARRSCNRQMQLWMSWKVLKLPGYAPANLPGCSHHNYGIAVDLRSVTSDLREILLSQGWSDIYNAEEWHFTCVESSAFNKIQAKINELRNGIAAQWAQDMATAYELNKKKNTYYTELKIRQQKFEGEVIEFNRHAKIYNDAKVQFHLETEPVAQKRDEILNKLTQLDQKINQLEKVYQEFRSLTDEIVQLLYQEIDEIRRLMSLSMDSLDQSIRSKVPANLKARYEAVRNNFFSLAQQVDTESNQIESMIATLGGQAGSFEQKAIGLLRQYEFLKNLRLTLENEKRSLERGFVDVQLMAQESIFRMSRAGQALETIQAEVNAVSA
jgi:hypothetical protein